MNPVELYSRVAEIVQEKQTLSQRICALDVELNEIIANIIALPGNNEVKVKVKESKKRKSPSVKLEFIEENKIVRWNGGELWLGEKRKQTWLILKTIYRSKRKYVSLSKLESRVWGATDSFLDKNMIRMAMKRTSEAIQKSFPYKIKKIKNSQTLEIKGYTLICSRSNR
ncbi:MAG: hypothetical protein LBK82_17580 [Planctomycetaceae bacterium]|jgi:DNA-binding response OmpR family regulator|nr:hypothetical protein [Planctomycetaceae bacterium]